MPSARCRRRRRRRAASRLSPRWVAPAARGFQVRPPRMRARRHACGSASRVAARGGRRLCLPGRAQAPRAGGAWARDLREGARGSDHRGSPWPCQPCRRCRERRRGSAPVRGVARARACARAHRAAGDGQARPPTYGGGCPRFRRHRSGAERRPGLPGGVAPRGGVLRGAGRSAAGRARQTARAEAGGSRVRPPAGRPDGEARHRQWIRPGGGPCGRRGGHVSGAAEPSASADSLRSPESSNPLAVR